MTRPQLIDGGRPTRFTHYNDHAPVILGLFEMTEPEVKASRAVGRPKKRTLSYLDGLLRERAAMAVWFQSAHGRSAKSDFELLNAFLQSQFQRHGMRASRIQSPEVQARIKTLRNHLSEARQVCSPVPETPLLPGCGLPHTDAH